MNSIKERYLIIILLLCSFVIGGFLHVFLYGYKLATCIVQIYYGAVVMIWAMSIQFRIIQNRVRHCLLLIAGMLIMYLIFQVERYNLIRDNALLMRNVWYWYYVPMIWIPLLFYFISQRINSVETRFISATNILLIILGGVLSALFVTNDLHHGAFVLSDMLIPDKDYRYGPVFTSFVIYMVVLYFVSIFNIIRKNQLITIKHLGWLPLLISLVGVAGIVMAEALDLLKINGIRIWNLTEWYAFIVIGILESCILIGLIPSNSGYMNLIKTMSVPIEFRQKDGKRVITSKNDYSDSKNMSVNTFPILGGNITWAVDMSRLYQLNEQLEAAAEQLLNRNNYLQTKNNTKEEQETLNYRNRVYDKITEIVLPQLIKIEEMLADPNPKNVDRNLPYIAVLNTYIKRRCNMELLKEDMEKLPLAELKLAISESASYLQLCNIETAVVGSDEGEYPADELIGAYEHFESVVEKRLSSSSSIMVVIAGDEGSITTRIMVDDEPIEEYLSDKEVSI